jgi:hypothetical protein
MHSLILDVFTLYAVDPPSLPGFSPQLFKAGILLIPHHVEVVGAFSFF